MEMTRRFNKHEDESVEISQCEEKEKMYQKNEL